MLGACCPARGEAGESRGVGGRWGAGDPVSLFPVVAGANGVAEDTIYSHGSGGQKSHIQESAEPRSVRRLLAALSSSWPIAVSLRSLPVPGCVSVLSHDILLCVCVRVPPPRLMRTPVTVDLRAT